MNGNKIHPTAIVGKNVIMGLGNYIGPYCIIHDGVKMGDDNTFHSYCSVGDMAQHKGFFDGNKKLIIGNNNTFREFCTLHRGTTDDTKIGNDNYLMSYCHVPHDALLGSGITIANSTQIGGHTVIQDYANIGLNCSIHQYSVIGAGSMLGMGSVVTKKSEIHPFKKYAGNPVKKIGVNSYMIHKMSTQADISNYEKEYAMLVKD